MSTIELWHGSNTLFDRFDPIKARMRNDLFGGGVAYLTNDRKVAEQYAEAMAKKTKTKDKILYRVKLVASKTFDEDNIYTGPILKKFIGTNVEEFARGAGLLSYGADKYAVLADLQSGRAKLTGKQVFLGMSKGMVETAKAREKLIKLGFDSLRYNGGLMGITTTKVLHDVWIGYDPNKIQIVKRELLN